MFLSLIAFDPASGHQHQDWTFLVSLQKRDEKTGGYKHLCAGSVINSNDVLTVGHCVYEGFPSVRPRQWRIVTGPKISMEDDQDEIGSVYHVDTIVLHPQFKGITKQGIIVPWNDLAIVTSVTKFNFKKVTNIPLEPRYDQGFTKDGQTCQIAGWGRLDPDAPKVRLMKSLNLKFISRESCINEYLERTRLNVSDFISFKSVCGGLLQEDEETKWISEVLDYGSPLVCQVRNVSYLVGSASIFTPEMDNLPATPAIFSHINHFRRFLEDLTATPLEELAIVKRNSAASYLVNQQILFYSLLKMTQDLRD